MKDDIEYPYGFQDMVKKVDEWERQRLLDLAKEFDVYCKQYEQNYYKSIGNLKMGNRDFMERQTMQKPHDVRVSYNKRLMEETRESVRIKKEITESLKRQGLEEKAANQNFKPEKTIDEAQKTAKDLIERQKKIAPFKEQGKEISGKQTEPVKQESKPKTSEPEKQEDLESRKAAIRKEIEEIHRQNDKYKGRDLDKDI